MKSFIVIGLGRFGSALATELYNLGHEVLGLDTDQDRVNRISDSITHAVVGDPQDEAVLKSIGARNFDCAIVASAEDIHNTVLVTLILKELGVKYVVAKAQNIMHMKLLEKVGADKVVFPERDSGQRLAHNLGSNSIIDYIELTDDYSIIEVRLPSTWAGKTLKQINIRSVYQINVIAIRSEGNKITVSPNADYRFKDNDIIVVVGSNDDIKKLGEAE